MLNSVGKKTVKLLQDNNIEFTIDELSYISKAIKKVEYKIQLNCSNMSTHYGPYAVFNNAEEFSKAQALLIMDPESYYYRHLDEVELKNLQRYNKLKNLGEYII